MSEFDGDLKVGDIIMSYHSGFHVVVAVKKRQYTQWDIEYMAFCTKGNDKKIGDEYMSLIHYRKIARKTGERVCGRAIRHCGAVYCTKIDGKYLAGTIKNIVDDPERRAQILEQFKEELGA